jgi:peptidylprolyl isomerase
LRILARSAALCTTHEAARSSPSPPSRLAAPLAAQDAPEPPTPASIVAAAPAADWRAIDPADLLVMTLAPDRDGNRARS